MKARALRRGLVTGLIAPEQTTRLTGGIDWVFTAPSASAATHTYSQQKYKVRILAVATNDYDCNTGTLTIYYRNENGTASSDTGTKSYDFGNSVGNCKNIFSGGGANYGYWPSTDGVEVEGFPYKAYAHHSKTSNGLFWNTDGSFDLYIQIYKANGWDDYGGTATNNGSLGGGYKKGIAVTSASISGKGDFGTTTTIANADYPKITSGNMSTAMASSSITCPATSSSASATNSFSSFSAPKDQYGVNMKYTITATGSTQSTAISVDASKVSVGFSANIAGSTNSQTVTVASSCPVKVSNSNSSSSNTFTLNDASYSVKFYDASNTEISGSAKTVQYGSDATAPSSPSKSWDADLVDGYHYQFKAWKTSSISADANKNVTENRDCYPDWNTTKHSWGSWSKYTGTSDGNDASAYHRSLCNVYSQSHYKYEAHKGAAWGTWAQGDANNHTQTCGTCGYVLTQAHTFTSETVKADAQKSAATCTKDAVYYKSCSVCGRVSTNESDTFTDIGSALGHNWTGAEYDGVDSLKTAADCTNDAVYYKVCSRCHLIHSTDTWIKQGTASGHSWNPTTFTFSEDGTTATATRVCKNDSNHTETQNATMSHAQKTAPTCTEKGWNTYTATSPFAGDTASDTNDVQDIPAKGHAYGDWADDGAENHKKVCANDANHVETEAHTFSVWSVTVPEGDAKLAAAMKQDYDASAECFRYCTVCYRVEYQAHDYNSVRTEATCLDSGEIVYTCKYCPTTYNEDIPASGHDFELTAVQPNDKVSGYTCYHCKNCDNYWNAPYNGGYTEPASNSDTGKADPGQLNNSDTIPAPYFNDFKEDYDGDGNVDYAYGERGSGLKLMKNGGEFNAATTKQDFRFSGSVAIPKDISYKIGSRNDNVIVDFGFVYSQDSHIWNVNKGKADTDQLVLDSEDLKIASMSVVNNNAAKGNVISVNDSTGRLNGENGEWSGVTFHPGDGSDEFPDSLTFNLVISIKATNWKMQYAARPYITYTYHGETYTVYDNAANVTEDNQDGYSEYSCCSVYSLASYIAVWNPNNSAAKYCTDNILAHEALLYPKSFEDNEKSDKFTDWWKWVEGDTSWSDFINPDRENSFYSAYSKFMKQ